MHFQGTKIRLFQLSLLSMQRNILFTLFSLAVFTLVTSCGSAEKSEIRARRALAIGEYAEAASHYQQAYRLTSPSEKEKRARLAYAMGESYRRYGASSRALAAFRTAERYHLTDTLTFLRQGQMAMLQGDYKGALTAFENQTKLSPDNRMLAAAQKRAEQGMLQAKKAIAERGETSLYTVKAAAQFNGNRSDYAPMLVGQGKEQQLYFTTTRSAVLGNEVSGITAQKNGDVFFVQLDEKGRWKTPEPVVSINTPQDEGAVAFSPDGKTMYLTVCPTHPQYPRMAEIWTAQRNDAAWGKPQMLKIGTDTLSSYAHPTVSPDGKWLYFTSDMPGGYGGLDLWRADIREGKGVGIIENLGASVNTSGDESFPSFRPNGSLYFSSDGRGGLGGLDLFFAQEDTLLHEWKVEHLPAPMNSAGNDFGITFDGLHNRGYFSSSRTTGGRGWDKIFEFSYPERLLTVKGWVYEQDGYELPAAQVQMVGSDGTNLKLPVKPDGSFEQEVHPGVRYVFLASCSGYLNFPNQLQVDSIFNEEHQYVLQFPLPSMNIPVLVRNVFYPFDKAEVSPESAPALERLAKLLTDNPHITIELAAHTDYRGSDAYNVNLSQRRAESVVHYLIKKGIARERLTAKGYGKSMPKVVNRRLAEQQPFLHENDTLSTEYILKLTPEQQEVCNALNRRTEFRVLRTTYGLFDANGNLGSDALPARKRD